MPCVVVDGVTFCGPGVASWVCGIDGCSHGSVVLCDYPIGDGKTCDLPLCRGHSKVVGPDVHLCPVHAAMFEEKAKGRKVNPKPGTIKVVK